jgi:phospholipase/carboxylesterase
MAGPHDGQPVLLAGEALEDAVAAMILLHGRGASGHDIMTLAAEVAVPGFAFLAPEAAGNAWYPNRFMEPLESNEPWLSSALETVGRVLARVEERVPAGNVILLGFSQGACLALEFAARNSRRYGGIAGLSGGLIGPDSTPRDYPGSLEGTPVFLGCSDVDPHIPKERVTETGAVFKLMRAEVTVRLYPGMAHTVSPEEIVTVNAMIKPLALR